MRGAHAVSQNYLGEAALTGRGHGYKRPDGRLRSYHSIDRHVYWDTAVADPAGVTALRGGSAAPAGAGVAARRRCAVKDTKYKALVESTGSQWVADVVERFGAVSGPLQGLSIYSSGRRAPFLYTEQGRFCIQIINMYLTCITYVSVRICTYLKVIDTNLGDS